MLAFLHQASVHNTTMVLLPKRKNSTVTVPFDNAGGAKHILGSIPVRQNVVERALFVCLGKAPIEILLTRTIVGCASLNSPFCSEQPSCGCIQRSSAWPWPCFSSHHLRRQCQVCPLRVPAIFACLIETCACCSILQLPAMQLARKMPQGR